MIIYIMNDYFDKTMQLIFAHSDTTFLKITINDVINGTKLTREDTISIINFLSEFMFEKEEI